MVDWELGARLRVTATGEEVDFLWWEGEQAHVVAADGSERDYAPDQLVRV
jgi:hypothetical protein